MIKILLPLLASELRITNVFSFINRISRIITYNSWTTNVAVAVLTTKTSKDLPGELNKQAWLVSNLEARTIWHLITKNIISITCHRINPRIKVHQNGIHRIKISITRISKIR